MLCNSGPTLPQKMSAFGLLTNGVDGVLAVGGWSPDRSTRLNEMWELKCVSDDSCTGWTLRGYFEDTRMAMVSMLIPESLIPSSCFD